MLIAAYEYIDAAGDDDTDCNDAYIPSYSINAKLHLPDDPSWRSAAYVDVDAFALMMLQIPSYSLQVITPIFRLVLAYTSLMIHLGGVGTGNGYFEWREPWANHYK